MSLYQIHLSHIFNAATLLIALAGCGTNDATAVASSADGPIADNESPNFKFVPELGKGVDQTETHTFDRCIVYPGLETKSLGTLSQRTYDEQRVTTHEDIGRILGVSASSSAKSSWGSGGANASFTRNIRMSDNAFYWLVAVKYQLHHQSINISRDDVQLSQNAKGILKNRGVKAFYDACGTHFYAGHTTGAHYNLLYEFRSNDEMLQTKLKDAATYSGSLLSAESRFWQAVALAKRFAALRVHAGIYGGQSDLLAYAEDAKSLKDHLAFLRRDLVERGQGKVLRWEIASYNAFPEVLAARGEGEDTQTLTALKDQALGDYWRRYTRNERLITKLENLVEKSSRLDPVCIFSEEKRKEIDNLRKELSIQNSEIASRATTCIAMIGQPCDASDLRLIASVLPEPDKDMRGLGT